ncbi:MAG: ATP-binding cassette domain-containing protein, partial [Ktedonobacteraceae bacterium]|nr:ATP-binding cassette domain-containing protein [Ktedonobacteraceae bacterium]
MDIILRTQHLKKHFGSVRAVEDVSISVRRGEIFGFLGPNGAGKTTTISMILGLTYPTAGTVEMLGERVTPGHTGVLCRVGTLVGAPALMLSYSARRNLEALARLYPDVTAARIDEMLEQMDLKAAAHRSVKTFSTGMKMRLGLALALLNRPELLILDEPTNGMDPAGMHEIRTLLRSLADQGTTILLSSHLLHEVEQTCDRVTVIQRGNIIAQGT